MEFESMQTCQEREVVLATIPGSDAVSRIQLTRNAFNMERPFCLRQESFSPDVGWFLQSSLEMTQQEFAMLRGQLGSREPEISANFRPPTTSPRPKTLPMFKIPAAS